MFVADVDAFVRDGIGVRIAEEFAVVEDGSWAGFSEEEAAAGLVREGHLEGPTGSNFFAACRFTAPDDDHARTVVDDAQCGPVSLHRTGKMARDGIGWVL